MQFHNSAWTPQAFIFLFVFFPLVQLMHLFFMSFTYLFLQISVLSVSLLPKGKLFHSETGQPTVLEIKTYCSYYPQCQLTFMPQRGLLIEMSEKKNKLVYSTPQRQDSFTVDVFIHLICVLVTSPLWLHLTIHVYRQVMEELCKVLYKSLEGHPLCPLPDFQQMQNNEEPIYGIKWYQKAEDNFFSFFFIVQRVVRWDGILSNPIQWEVSLTMTRNWNQMGFKVLSKPNHFDFMITHAQTLFKTHLYFISSNKEY